ncbi:MAG TPA: hypothetical protein VK249_20530 [Anaerolineales bacterium]|nr:hypothetical protein [Anaerolineales bacterium]
MEYSPELNPVFLIPTGIVVLLDLLSFPLYFRWIESGEIQKSRMIFLFKPFSILIGTYFIFTQFGSGTLFGAMYCMIVPFIALGMLAFFLTQVRRDYQKNNTFTKADTVNLVFGILVILSMTVPSFLFSPINAWCANENSSKMPFISQAVEKYHSENGKYPKKIDELVPDFMSSIPGPSCSLLSGTPRKFELNNCQPPYVFVWTIDFGGYDLYSLRDGARTFAGSFLDRGPYFCP